MSKVNGKNKGNAFERKIANLLSERFQTHLGIEKGFRRNPDSGSFFGGKNESRVESYDQDFALFGDLICPRAFMYSVECKNYKTPPSFASFLSGSITEWEKWIAQAMSDSRKSNKSMLLIIKYNNVPEFVLTDRPLVGQPGRFKYGPYDVYTLADFISADDSFYFSTADEKTAR